MLNYIVLLYYCHAGEFVPKPVLKQLILLKILEWFNIGLLLDLEEHDLKAIKRSCGDDFKACCREMFSLWLQTETNPSYQRLIKVLYDAEELEAAKQLQRWFGKYILFPPHSHTYNIFM